MKLSAVRTAGRSSRSVAIRARAAAAALAAVVATFAGPAGAGGRLLATDGVMDVEGTAGGGIVPWALVAGTGTRDEVGLSAFHSYLGVDGFRLQSTGAAIGLYDRVELSYARQTFGLGSTVPGDRIRMDVYGGKVRLYGDAVYDQDRWIPQVAFGVERKDNRDFAFVPQVIGARRASGTDLYLAATKLYLAGLFGRNLLLDGTLRATKANQLGLLGFGGDLDDRYRLRFEGSAAVFANDNLAFGGELRTKPNNLSAFQEQSFGDVFLAWIPSRYVSVTAARVWLGRVADRAHRRGGYVSLKVSD